MREIKFRAWNEWDTGSEMIYFDIDHSKTIEDLHPKAKVMQFTGRCDKNNKEIYEGDIVSSAGAVGEIVFEAPSFYWALPDGEDLLDIPLDGEVIGDVYRNLDLLDRKQNI